MSSERRVCKNCGASLEEGQRECPKCGRLNIDRRRARLGATRTYESVENLPPIGLDDKPAPETKDTSLTSHPVGSDNEPLTGPKPASFFSIGPANPPKKCPGCGKTISASDQTCSYCGHKFESKEKKSCCFCALALVAISWFMVLIAVL